MNNHSKDCIFCKIINNELNSMKLLENDNAMAILDLYPVSFGHALIISKKHYKNLSSTPKKVLNSMMSLIKDLSLKYQLLSKEIKGFNYLSNENSEAEQVIFHTHLHLIPKYNKKYGFIISKNINNLDLKPSNFLKIYNSK